MSNPDDQELPGMLELQMAVAKGKWPHSTDAMVWAEEFCKRYPGMDKGEMIGWFAGAIMAGHDAASMLR